MAGDLKGRIGCGNAVEEIPQIGGGGIDVRAIGVLIGWVLVLRGDRMEMDRVGVEEFVVQKGGYGSGHLVVVRVGFLLLDGVSNLTGSAGQVGWHGTMDKMNDSLNVVEESVNVLDQLVPAGGAGDVLMLPLSPTPQPEQEEDDQSEQPEQDQQDQPPPSTPPRPIPVLFEPPAVLRRRHTSHHDSDNEEEYVPALRANAIEAWRLAEQLTEPPSPAGRQIGRSITPVAGEQAVPPVCFMSDTEGDDTDREEEEEEEGYEQDGEEATEAEEEEETTQLGAQGDGLIVPVPFWLFGLTCLVMTLYLTFVIYLLSWECRMPMPLQR